MVLSHKDFAVFLSVLQNLDYPDKSDDRYLTQIFRRKKRQDWEEKEADPTDHNNCYSTGQEIKTAAVSNNKYIRSN